MIRILTFLLLAAAAAPGFAQSPEKLGAGDAVRVTVFGQPDLTTEARVSDRGTIDVPLIGSVKLAGLSTADASKAISEALVKGEFLKHPSFPCHHPLVVNVLGTWR